MDLSRLNTSDPEVPRQVRRIVGELQERRAKIATLGQKVDKLEELLEEYGQHQRTLKDLEVAPIKTKLPFGVKKAVTEAVVGLI